MASSVQHTRKKKGEGDHKRQLRVIQNQFRFLFKSSQECLINKARFNLDDVLNHGDEEQQGNLHAPIEMLL